MDGTVSVVLSLRCTMRVSFDLFRRPSKAIRLQYLCLSHKTTETGRRRDGYAYIGLVFDTDQDCIYLIWSSNLSSAYGRRFSKRIQFQYSTILCGHGRLFSFFHKSFTITRKIHIYTYVQIFIALFVEVYE